MGQAQDGVPEVSEQHKHHLLPMQCLVGVRRCIRVATPVARADTPLSYAALGLLPSIPLPKGPSSSRSHRANLPFLPPHLRGAAAAFDGAGDVDADADADAGAAPKVGFGRIIRDEEGNVVDIIIDEEPEQEDAQDDEEEPQREPVLAKTDVVMCEWVRLALMRWALFSALVSRAVGLVFLSLSLVGLRNLSACLLAPGGPRLIIPIFVPRQGLNLGLDPSQTLFTVFDTILSSSHPPTHLVSSPSERVCSSPRPTDPPGPFRGRFLLCLYPNSDLYPKSGPCPNSDLHPSRLRPSHSSIHPFSLPSSSAALTHPAALEALSATSAPVIRHSSTSEKTWLHDLVAFHGDDTQAMARDRKRNVWQKTEGEIRRMIKKAGGRGRLMAMATATATA